MATKKIAFYTTGDKRPVLGAKAIIGGRKRTVKMSKMWELRAESLAGKGQTHGVATVDAAILKLQKLEKGAKLTKVFFVGHGYEGGFFFSGKPSGSDGFEADDVNTLWLSPKMKVFAKTLAGFLSKDEAVEVAFLSCYTGKGRFTRPFYDELRGHGVKNLTVGAFRDYYETRFKVDARGNIVGWSDRIIDSPEKGKVLVSAIGNGIPRYQVLHQEIKLDSFDLFEDTFD